jgi:AraC-like DNA-binding protein
MVIKRKDLATILELRQFMEENLCQDISVELLSKKAGFNRTKLQEGFSQLFGLTIHAFLFQARMDKAKSLLAGTDEPVKYIATECGYKTLSSFTRAFTRQHKISPNQYRKQALT